VDRSVGSVADHDRYVGQQQRVMMRVLLVELRGAVVGVVALLDPVVLDLHESVEHAGAGGLRQGGLKDGVIDRAKASCSGQIDIGRSWRFGRHVSLPSRRKPGRY